MTSEPRSCDSEMARKQSFLDGFRVIHLHPTLRCNLKCKHCYSSSEPKLKKQLEPGQIIDFLAYAKNYGFNAISLSGGEPLLYKGLESVLEHSREMGYTNLMASNAMLFRTARARRILSLIDLIAVSIDGNEYIHDEIRSFKGAFAKMEEGVDILKELKVTFGYIHTLTGRSWDILPWLMEYAHGQGAKLLQLHPLEMYGRALREFSAHAIDQELLHKFFIMGNFYKSKYFPDMFVQLDFLHKDHVLEHPETATYFGPDPDIKKEDLSKALKTIVVDENGNILPLSYGFSPQYGMGNIHDLKEGEDVFSQFYKNKWSALYKLLEETYNDIINDKENDLIAWTELIVKNSRMVHC